MRRLFLAVDFDAAFRDAIGAYAMSVRPHFMATQASWVESRLYHLTLHFFGDLENEKSKAIIDSLAAFPREAVAPQISVSSLDFLPSRRQPRVLCLKLAIEPAKALEPVIAEARRLADRVGAASDSRPWRAHLTLARFKDSRAAIGPEPPPPPRITAWPDTFCLMESHLAPRGPSYTIVERYGFRASAPT